MTAKEKHEYDKNRVETYIKNLNNPIVVIVWESSFKELKNKEDIKSQINEFINNENNKGKILWI